MLSFMERRWGIEFETKTKRRRCLVLILCNNGGDKQASTGRRFPLWPIANKANVAVLFCLSAWGGGETPPLRRGFHNYGTGLYPTTSSPGKAEALPYGFFPLMPSI